MAQGKTTIGISNLSKSFGKIKAVDGISLTVPEGEIFALLGPNGAGKTTTISMLCGLLAPTGGNAIVAGFDVQKEPLKVRQQIGVVFQQPSVDDLLTGKENMIMHAYLYGMKKEGLEERIEDMLELVELKDRQHSRIKEYSGGMRKRLELVRGILHRPKILFLDEPTVGLDPQTRAHIWQYIRKLSQSQGTTVVFTTHYLEEAEAYADRVAIIDHGKIISVGTPKGLVESLGGDIVNLKFAQPKAAIAKIKKMKFASSVKLEKDGVVSVTVAHLKGNLPVLLKAVSGIESIEIHPDTLNDVFIKYTGKQIRGEGGEGGFWDRIMNDK